MESLETIGSNSSKQKDGCSSEQNTDSDTLSSSHPNSPIVSGMMSCNVKDSRVSQGNKNKRPAEESPTKLRTLAPKSLFTEKVEYIPLPKISKRKAHETDLKQAVRPILPKPYMFKSKGSSPTKTAALMLKRKATLVCQRMSPVKALTKRPSFESVPPPPTFSRVFTRSQGNKADLLPSESTPKADCPQTQTKLAPSSTAEQYTINRETDTAFECEQATIIQGEECEDVEKDEDQMQLDDLMAACTTIKYDPKKSSMISQDGDTKSKSQKRREICLSMLEEDILETDPKKDERDTQYAKDFFNRVKHALQHDPERFRQFLITLHEMNKDNGNPVKLYAEISSLLHDHQDLVDDFATFLLAHQAVECGCFVAYIQYQQLREFFRKLEIYCENTTTPFQRTLKILSKWLTSHQETQCDAVPFKERVSSALKNVPGILDELLDYYLDGQLPDSQSDEFEEVDLETTNRVSGFEEVTLPAGPETYNTKLCGCSCHENKNDERFQRRTRHCFSCSLKLDNGMPVLKMSKHEYQPLTVIYPHEEREKLKKAKREAAQLALAKAKAQKSGTKKNKTKGSAQSGKSKRLSIKRKQRRRLTKPRKERTRLVAGETTSDVKADDAPVDPSRDCTGNSDEITVQVESQTSTNLAISLRSETQAKVTHSTSVCVLGKIDDRQAQIVSMNQNQDLPARDFSSTSNPNTISATPSTVPPLPSSSLLLQNLSSSSPSMANCINSRSLPDDAT